MKRKKTTEGFECVTKFISTGILFIEQEPDVLDWWDFQKLIHLIETNIELRRIQGSILQRLSFHWSTSC